MLTLLLIGLIATAVGTTTIFILCLKLEVKLRNLKIDNEKLKQRAEYHEKELKRRAGEDENTNGYAFEERK